jgi:hypothetical protein
MTGLLAVIADRLQKVKWRGSDQFTACCPAHEDRTPSLSVKATADRILVHCHAGCTVEAICAAIDLTPAELFFKPNGHQRSAPRVAGTPERRIVATYDYTDEAGNLLFQTVRYTPKDFRQRRPDGNGGWQWNLEGARLVLYNLPEVLHPENKTILICEGEKDCLKAHEKTGLCATTNPMGALKWRPEYSEFVRGKNAIIFPHNDMPGPKGELPKGYVHAQQVATSLFGTAASVKVCTLPPKTKDFAEWNVPLDEMVRYIAEFSIPWTPHTAAPIFDETRRAASERSQPGPMLRCFSDIVPKPLRWLWPGRIPLGKLTLLIGDPGLGKSLLTTDIASRVTRGTKEVSAATAQEHQSLEAQTPSASFPDGAPCESGSVIFLSAEDDAADTIRPRLDVAKADVSRVHILEAVRVKLTDGSLAEKAFNLETDCAALEVALREHPDVRLIVIDPISAYLGGVDSHSNAEVRGVLAPLAALAAQHGVAVLCVTHLRKSAGVAVYRAIASIAFTAASRAVWAVASDPEDADRRLLLQVKQNLSASMGGLAFRIEAQISVPRLTWEPGAVTLAANDVLGNLELQDQNERREAKVWLEELLADGPVAVKKIKREAHAAGLSWTTVRRAKDGLSVAASKNGYQGAWQWQLKGAHLKDAHPIDTQVSAFEQPAENTELNGNQTTKDAHQSEVSTFEALGDDGEAPTKPTKPPAGTMSSQGTLSFEKDETNATGDEDALEPRRAADTESLDDDEVRL